MKILIDDKGSYLAKIMVLRKRTLYESLAFRELIGLNSRFYLINIRRVL